MLVLEANVQIGGYAFAEVERVEVSTNRDATLWTASITLPRRLRWRGRPLSEGGAAIFRPQDVVEIQLGYRGLGLKTVFTGFVKRVEPGAAMLKIECENEVYLLRQSPIKAISYKKVQLGKLLNDIQPYAVIADEVDLGAFRAEKTNAAKVLEDLRETWGIRCFFSGQTLFAGYLNTNNPQRAEAQLFSFRGERANIVSSSLAYQRADEQKIKVRAVSIRPNNTKQEIEVGDADGDLRTFTFYDKSLTDLRRLAQESLARTKYEGFRGEFTAFGEPHVRPGDVAQVEDGEIPERNGRYRVLAVDYTFGAGGYRQVVKIGEKV